MNGTTISISELKQKTAEAIDHVVESGEPLTVVSRSKPKAILSDVEYFKALEEAVFDMTDAKEAEKAKRESKDPLEKYIRRHWGKKGI